MRALITGGFGFLGTHLTEEILANEPDANIHIVDDLSTSLLGPDEYLGEIDSPPTVTYEVTTIEEYLTNSPTDFDQIYHLASIVGPAGVLPHAGRIASSIINDANMIANAAETSGARLLDVSTSEIYGGGNSKEDDPKLITPDVSVRLEYAVGKLAAEVALINHAKVSPLDVVIVRPFNVAGPRQSPKGGFVLPRFCIAALNDEPLTVFGSGQQVRAFTHVKDMARGLYLTMQRGRSGEAYNIGNANNATTIQKIAEEVIRLSGSNSEIEYVDPKSIYGELYEEAKDKTPDVTKAKNELGWHPTRDNQDIVTDTLDYIKTRL